MQAADIAIGLRRRSPWEAMDLGLTMLQRWGRQVYLPHVLFAIPLMTAALAAGWWFERAWVALLAIWWMKPAYDRVVLHVLSRAVFGELPTTRAVFGAAKEWLRTGLLTALLLRLWPDTSRSFTLPVRQLEGQSGRAEHRARGRQLAEHRARQHMQHDPVVSGLHPPDGEQRDPCALEPPSCGERRGHQRDREQHMRQVNLAPPALQHGEPEIHRLPRRAPAQADGDVSGLHASARLAGSRRAGAPSRQPLLRS